MSGDAGATVGIVSSRADLEVAINTWLPGYLARTGSDVEAVLDLVGDDGVVVVDLVDADRRDALRVLKARGEHPPVVAVLPMGRAGDRLPGDPVQVTAPPEMMPLSDALARAHRHAGNGAGHGRHDALIEAGSVATAHSGAALTPGPGRSRAQGGPDGTVVREAVGDRVIDLTEPVSTPDTRPGACRGSAPHTAGTDVLEVGAVLQAWALLDELEDDLGSASAVVAVRTTDGAYVPVAGIDLAPLEVAQPIPGDHPLLTQLTVAPGWLLRTPADRDSCGDLPLQACGHLLVVGLARASQPFGGLLLIGHFRPLDATMATVATSVAADGDRLRRRIAARGGPSLAPTPGGPSAAALLPAGSVPASWRLLSRLYAYLRGPAVVLTRSSSGDFVTTAAQHIAPRHVVRVIGSGHALLERVRSAGGPVVLASRSEPGELMRGLPLPPVEQLGVFPVGDPTSPHALVLLGRDARIPYTDLQQLRTAIEDGRALDLAPGSLVV